MKKVLGLIILILGLSGMYSCNEEAILLDKGNEQQDLTRSFTGENVVPGQLVIKLAKEPAEVKIVQTRSGEPQIETGLKTIDEICASIGASNMKRVFPPAGKFEARSRKAGLHLWYEVEFPEEVSLTRAAFDFSNSEDITLVEPVYLIKEPIDDSIVSTDSDPILQSMQTRSSAMSEDPKRYLQWHYKNNATTNGFIAGADINLYEAWSKTMGHPDVIVAIIDAGIQSDHPDLTDNMWINEGEISGNGIDDDDNGYIDDYHGYNFHDDTHSIVVSNHGTHVAGTIGAVNNNGEGVSGIAGGNKALNKKGVRLMDCKVADHQTGRLTSNTVKIAQAIKYGADNGAVISQNSWGGPSKNIQIAEAIDYFVANAGINEHGVQTGPMKGGIVIAASGNQGTQGMRYPAGYSNVIAVNSIGPDFKRAYYSNYGSWTDITAPGGNADLTNGSVYSTLSGGQYGYMQGTSMACPHVSGIAALILSEAVENGSSGSMTPEILKERLLMACSSTKLHRENPNFVGRLGAGLINANNALLPTTDPTILGPDTITAGLWKDFYIFLGNLPTSEYTVSWRIDGANFESDIPAYGTLSLLNYDSGDCCTIYATISGRYNGYQKTIFKEVYISEREGYGTIQMTIDNASYSTLNFTLHGSDLVNTPVPKGMWDLATQVAVGEHRFTVECSSASSAPYPIETVSFVVEITQKGAQMVVEVEDTGLYMISLSNNSYDHKGFLWYYDWYN